MRTTRIDFNYLKQTVSIISVLSDKGLLPLLKRRGNDLVGSCPVHGGDNPRAFVVNLEKNVWYCFTRCQGGGDVIELVRKLDRKSYVETAEYLMNLSGTTPNASSYLNRVLRIANSSEKPNGTRFKPFTSRVPLDPNTNFLKSKAITPKTAQAFEVGVYHQKGFLAGSIGIRLHDIFGNPLGYAGRRLDPTQIKKYGKWRFPKGFPKKEILYNFHRVRPKLPSSLVVVECPWGVMRLAQLDIPAVALLGTTLSSIQLNLLAKTSRIILMLDGDHAGRIATAKIENMLQPRQIVFPVMLPLDKDPDDLSDLELFNRIQDFF